MESVILYFSLFLCWVVRFNGFSFAPKFSWYQQWYPVGVKDHLIEDEPTLIHLLNKKIVIWRGKEEWHAFDEACPHRLASFSFAQVDHDQDQLMCRYHGQRFDASGRLVFNPMAPSCSKITSEGNPSRKGNVQSYPTKLAYGLLWIWPSEDLSGIETKTPMMPPEMAVGNGTDSAITSIYKEWPLDWVGMVENNLDPSHAQFTHEGAMSFQSEVRICIPINAPYYHSYSHFLLYPSSLHILTTHPSNTHSQHTPSTLPTHPINTPYQHALLTRPMSVT